MDVLAASESIISEGEQAGASRKTEAQIQTENKFQKAIAVWKGIDLGNLLQKLDSTATDIVAHQKDSLVQRKELAQKTKEFKRYDDATKLAEVKGLLKLYQSFIDLLTGHGKTASNSFLQLYTALSEAPDPYPLLEASIDSLVISEDSLPRLASEKATLEKRVHRLSTQLESTETKLEQERAARRELEQNQDKKTKEIESSWEAVLSEKTNNWEAKEKAYEEKTENYERLLKEVKANLEVSQRLNKSEDGSETTAPASSTATSAELEIVSAELERTSSRLAEVEARNEKLRLELAQAVSHPHAGQAERNVQDDPAYQRLQSENSALLRKLETVRYDKDSERHVWEGKLGAIERASAKITAERDELKSKLEKCVDYEDIKRELEVIKSIELTTAGDDDEQDDHGDSKLVAGSSSGKEDSLEQLLLTRNKKLSNELTLLRVSHRDLQSQLHALQGDLSKTKSDLEQSQKLSQTLENDLLQLQSHTPNMSSALSVAPTHASRYPQRSLRTGRVSPTSSIISGFDHSGSTLDAIRAGEPVGGGSGILPMVQAQRDRFKQKNDQLEEELSKTYATVRSLRQEVASLQKDNLNLYEKTRYISTYSRHGGGGGGGSAVRNDGGSLSAAGFGGKNSPMGIREPGSGSDIDPSTVSRYSSAYEAQMSPFAAFRGRESARALQRMSLPERMVYSVTRLVLANRTTRNLFAAYCVAIHFLLFVFIYKMSVLSGLVHESTLGGKSSTADGAGAPAGGVDLTQMLGNQDQKAGQGNNGWHDDS
ncbi:hypothetical protein KEM54_005777 [Ascosphaera aggregata]|nr:hypothetical protein KEM54_005777 [Ascosphaera aggregata]